MTSMVGTWWTPCGIVLSVHSLLDGPRMTRRVSYVSVPARVASARPCVSNKKTPGELGSFVRRFLMAIVYPRQTCIQPIGCNLDRSETK